MTVVLLLLIALCWTVWLVPKFVRHRRAAHPTGSINAFHQQLSILSALDRTVAGAAADPAGKVGALPLRRHSQPAPVTTLVPAPVHRSSRPEPSPMPVRRASALTRSQARQRRRDVLCALATAAVLTLILGVALGPIALYAHLIVDVALVAYVVLLVRAQRLAADRQAKVRYLPQRSAHPSLMLRRSASS